MSDDGNSSEIDNLKLELQAKQEQINQLQASSTTEETLTAIIQDLQDNINTLYDEKEKLEKRLGVREKRSVEDQEEEATRRLQTRLNEKESEINELNHQISQMDNRLKSAVMQNSEDIEQSLLRHNMELQNYEARFRELTSEKEEIRLKAEEQVRQILQEKEAEIDGIKVKIAEENTRLLEALSLRDRDIENLQIQIQQNNTFYQEELFRKSRELDEAQSLLAQGLTKDSEISNLKIQIDERDTKIEELLTQSEEGRRQLNELKNLVQTKGQQIQGLQQLLDEKVREMDLIQSALERHVGTKPVDSGQTSEQSQPSSLPYASNELDVALYMLHQRDVRCEELTRELTHLLEERDTLQLRLSNSIRVNEELKKHLSSSTTKTDTETTAALVENLAPSTSSEGPVEIAKEAINSSIGEDKEALAQK